MSKWVVAGESYPGYTDTVAHALGHHPQSSGVYAASHNAAVKRWAAYYQDQATADAVEQEADRLADILDEASVLADIQGG